MLAFQSIFILINPNFNHFPRLSYVTLCREEERVSNDFSRPIAKKTTTTKSLQ